MNKTVKREIERILNREYGLVLPRSVVLDRVVLGFDPGSPGALATVSKRTLLTTGEAVTGQISDYWFTLYPTATRHEWGEVVTRLPWPLTKAFLINAKASYNASSSKHTRMDLKFWKPSGTILTGNDDDMWPYASPGQEIHFVVGRPLGLAIDEDGVWYAELTYMWVE